MPVGERRIVEEAYRIFRWHPSELMGKGDDVAVLKLDGGYYVFHIDSLVWSTDVPPGMGFDDAGWKAVTASLSDLAAKGARPLGVLVSGGFEPGWTEENIRDLLRGVSEAVEAYGTYVLGGDTNESADGFLSVFAFGISDAPPPRRGGARPGDYVVVTGELGLTAVAFKILLEGFDAPPDIRDASLRAAFRPVARFDAGYALAPFASAAMDISDGLALSLHQMCELSGVGVKLTSLPIHRYAVRFSEMHGLDVDRLTLYEGGEEYELLFAVPPEMIGEALRAAESSGLSIHVIGRFTEEKELRYVFRGVERVLERVGWEHLKS